MTRAAVEARGLGKDLAAAAARIGCEGGVTRAAFRERS
jgi:hypothetical protein